MAVLIAIGGGENGRPGTQRQTRTIDQYIVGRTQQSDPHFLFIPTASSDHPGYVSVMEKNYSGLGCTCDSLLVHDCKLSPDQIRAKIARADIIYVGGGNTQHMMDIRKKHGVDILLREACSQQKVLCGLSAGSICRFEAGQSDTEKFSQDSAGKRKYKKVVGLGIIPAIHAPHFDVEFERKTSRPQFVQDFGGIGIGIDECCALVYDGKSYMVIDASSTANAYKCFWHNGIYTEEILPKGKSISKETLLSQTVV